MHKLLEESQKIKQQADKILEESGIIDILKNYGEVKIIGSYVLDVMLRPDLDLLVITQKHDWAKVPKISSKIMESKYFREFDGVDGKLIYQAVLENGVADVESFKKFAGIIL